MIVALLLFLLVPALIIALGARLTTVNPRRRPAAAGRFAARVGVELTPELAADVTRRLVRRDRFDVAGRVVGVLAIVLAGGAGPTGVLFGLFVWLGGGRAMAHLTEARRASRDRTRVAHLIQPRLTDYVRPAALACVRAAVLIPLVLTGLWPLARHTHALAGARWFPIRDRLVVVTAAVVLAAWLMAEVTAWLVLRQRRVAGSPAELALDDAFRASTLHDLAVLPMGLGVYGSLAVGTEIEHVLPAGWPGWLGGPQPTVAALGLVLAAIVIEAVRAPAWRRRLYPAPATVPVGGTGAGGTGAGDPGAAGTGPGGRAGPVGGGGPTGPEGKP
ncbi:MAG: hypothetical protein V7637_3000 [Mycobacteriales bacterium]